MEKKVLFLFHECGRNDGASHSMMDIIDYLALNGVKPVIAFPSNDGTMIDYAKKKGYEVIKLNYCKWTMPMIIKDKGLLKYALINFYKLLPTIKSYFYLKKKIKKDNIKIVYTNTYTIFLGSLLKKRCNIYHIWHIREFGNEDHKLKIIIGDKKFIKYMNLYTDKIIFISKSLRNKYIDKIKDKKKVTVLYNDFPPINNLNPNKRWKNTKILNILIAGTIQEGKGQLEAVKAIEIVINEYNNKNIRLYIAGRPNGKYYRDVKEYIEKHNLNEYVIFAGFIDNMNSFREKMHLGVVCSKSEAFGRITIEGMLSGMVMIGANKAGTSELIKNNENGYLYELSDIKKLAYYINYCYNNISKIKRISSNATYYSINNFTKYNTSKIILKMINGYYKN